MKTKKPAVLELCGLGALPLEETTLESLQAFRDADRVYTDIEDGHVLDWLRPFCRSLERCEGGAAGAAKLLKRASRFKRAAVAVRGHPVLSSALCRAVMARPKGFQVKILAAVSPIGSAFALSKSFLGGDYGYQGIQGLDPRTVSEEPGLVDLKLPLVVFDAGGAGAEHWKAAAAALGRLYAASHRVLVFGDGTGEEGRREPVSALGSMTWPVGGYLLVPPSAAPRRRGGAAK